MTAVVAIIVASITGVVGPMLVVWLNRRELKNRVGTPNGNGNLSDMAESLLVLMAEHTKQDDKRFDELSEQIAELRGGGT